MSSNVRAFPVDSFSARLKLARKTAGLTQGELAEKLGVRQSAVSNWEQGASKPDISLLAELAAALHVTFGELLGSKDADGITSDEKDLLRRCRQLSDANRRILNITLDGMLAVQRSEERLKEPTVELKDFRRVLELADHAAAGTGAPMTASRYERTHTYIRTDAPDARADLIVTVNGQSMEPRYHHGDRLRVIRTEQMNYGEVGVFIVNNELYVKQYDRQGLLSLNPAFPHVEIHEDDQVKCIGKVIGILAEAQCADKQQTAILEELWSERLRGR